MNKRVKEVIPLKFAVGKADGYVKFWEGKGESSVMTNKGDKIVRVIKLDTFYKILKKRGEKVGVIKIDIEGPELDALEGGIDLISQERPILFIASYHYECELYDVLEFLEKVNYKAFITNIKYPEFLIDTIVIGIPEELLNDV